MLNSPHTSEDLSDLDYINMRLIIIQTLVQFSLSWDDFLEGGLEIQLWRRRIRSCQRNTSWFSNGGRLSCTRQFVDIGHYVGLK